MSGSVCLSSIGAGLAFLTSLPVQDGGPHDFRSKMAAPTKKISLSFHLENLFLASVT